MQVIIGQYHSEAFRVGLPVADLMRQVHPVEKGGEIISPGNTLYLPVKGRFMQVVGIAEHEGLITGPQGLDPGYPVGREVQQHSVPGMDNFFRLQAGSRCRQPGYECGRIYFAGFVIIKQVRLGKLGIQLLKMRDALFCKGPGGEMIIYVQHHAPEIENDILYSIHSGLYGFAFPFTGKQVAARRSQQQGPVKYFGGPGNIYRHTQVAYNIGNKDAI